MMAETVWMEELEFGVKRTADGACGLTVMIGDIFFAK